MENTAYFKEVVRYNGKSVVAAGLLMSAFLMLGTPPWKAVAAFVIILIMHRAGIGRKFTEFFAYVAIVISLIIWTHILPSLESLMVSLSVLR